ncbi:MAG: type II secretion system GspH family protein [Polyangiaceae bacterium]|nr:type II secretion system GspH family protein [Polyangiaceae bacterium]
MQRTTALAVRLVTVASRGVTLIEVLIVVAILSLIAAGVSVAVLPAFRESKIKTTTSNALTIRGAVTRWRSMRGSSECPTVSQLLQDKQIDTASKTTDAWDQPFKIECSEDETTVSSPGPDKKENSNDDIVVPERAGKR